MQIPFESIGSEEEGSPTDLRDAVEPVILSALTPEVDQAKEQAFTIPSPLNTLPEVRKEVLHYIALF